MTIILVASVYCTSRFGNNGYNLELRLEASAVALTCGLQYAHSISRDYFQPLEHLILGLLSLKLLPVVISARYVNLTAPMN